ncbi:PucR family transcriptional regulator [Streptomyces chartreusis]|uniref:PucR family transcriptional regulator n=1 Tax=Streptomyces chartreusis TaxID=1969 RepID=UPI003640D838
MVRTTRNAGEHLQSLVDDLADDLGRSVAVNDPVVRVLCTSRHFGDEDRLRVRAVLQRDAGAEASEYILGQGVARWAGPGVLDGCADLGMNSRLCVPLREQGELLGLLMVTDADSTLTAAEITRIEEVSKTAAALLYRDRLAADSDRAEREHTVMGLLSPDPAARHEALRAATGYGWPTDTAQVVVSVLHVRGRPTADAETELALRNVLDSAARRQPQRLLPAVADGRGVLVQVRRRIQYDEALALVLRMAGGLGQLLPDEGTAVAGVSSTGDGLDSAWRLLEQARVAARGARLVSGLGPVATWESIGAYGILLRLPDAALEPALIPDPLARLLRHEKGPRLAETLKAFLDHGGSIPRTAEALHLHRTSLYYRLDQIRSITGADLDDGRDRLLLHMGLLACDLVPTVPR